VPRQADMRTLRAEFVNPRARMLPLFRYQEQVYKLADRYPPGLEGFQPRWEVVNAVLGSKQTLQQKIDLQPAFHLLAVGGSSTVNTVGGFRVHIYDKSRNLRIGGDRGLQFPNLGGASGSFAYLTDPYPFDIPRSQVQVELQNLESSSNTISIVLYGACAAFTGARDEY
jgi:hypothetical protein